MAPPGRYAFGDFTLDVRERQLLRGHTSIALQPKAHDLLAALVQQAGRLVTKRDLLDLVWPDAYVDEGILAVHVSGLRKALGDDRNGHRIIETVPRAGYRFVMPVTAPLESPRHPGAATPPPRNPDVLRLFGRGRAHLLSASMFEARDAAAAFQAAVDGDPSYAAAHAGLALAHCAQASLRATPHADAYARAKASALRALAMDPQCADAQTALGAVLMMSEWDWRGAAYSLDRALDLAPHHTQAALLRGHLCEALGALDRGLAIKLEALERDPDSPLVLLQIALSCWNQRRYDDSMAWATRALAIDPTLLLAREHVIGACWMRGDFARMAEENVKQAESFGAPPDVVADVRAACGELTRVHAAEGRAGAMRSMLKIASERPQPASPIQLAVLSGEVGDLDAAFRHLDHAIDNRDPSLVHLAVAPQWDSLRGDRRMGDRLAKLNLPTGWRM